jgi:phosphoribosylformylglycinamidine (FGAM) synthase PurS component
MPKDYLEQLEEDKQILNNLTLKSSMSNPQIDAIERAIERLDKEIKHVKWCRCQ